MVLHDHQTTTVRRSFNFQSQVQFHNRQIHHERFNPLLVISPIKFCDDRELRKTQN